MKYLVIIFLLLSSCKMLNFKEKHNENTLFKVISIESSNKINIIYANNNGNVYKILSKRKINVLFGTKKIICGNRYPFNFKSLLINRKLYYKNDTFPIFPSAVNSVEFEDTTILKGINIFDIGIATNIQDLYFIK